MMIGIIEDDRLLNQALNKMLTDKGYDTTCAHSREEALALSVDRIDLFLIDIGLPDGDGLKLYRELKAEKDVPAIFPCYNKYSVILTKPHTGYPFAALFDIGGCGHDTGAFRRPILNRTYEDK